MEYKVKEDENRTEWYLGEKLHKENGPAVEFTDGTKEWWIDGKRHREDGAAIEFDNGTKKWFLDGKNLSEEDFEAAIKAKHAPPEELPELRFNYTVEEVKEWLEDFRSVVMSPETGQIRWAKEQTNVDMASVIDQLEDGNNGLHAFVNELGKGNSVDVPTTFKAESNSATVAGFFTFLCILIFLAAGALYFFSRFQAP